MGASGDTYKFIDLFRHVTNGAESLAFATLFSIFVFIMFWHMQILRRVFRLKDNNSIVNPIKVVFVHLLILTFLITYALFSGQIDYYNKNHSPEGELQRYYNPIIYALLMNISSFSQVTAYVLTIKNWLWIIQGLQGEQERLPRYMTKLSIPLLLLTFVLQVIFVGLILYGENNFVYTIGLIVILLYILLINLMSLSSWSIHKFFKSAYSDSYYLTRAIILVNFGLQIQSIINLVHVTDPNLIQQIKHYDIVKKTDLTVNWAILWSLENLFGSIVPTIFIIILVRPVLFLIPENKSENNSVFKSTKSFSVKKPLSKQSVSVSDSFTLNHDVSISTPIYTKSQQLSNIIVGSQSMESSKVVQSQSFQSFKLVSSEQSLKS